MTTAMNQQGVQDHMELFSHMYPALYSQAAVPEQGEAKVRRRRKKSKAESSGGCARKRKLSTEQVTHLELNFGNEHKLESERKDKIAAELGLDPRQVAVWFQNRRARWKSKKLEEEFSKMKIIHDSVVVEKCRLETEVIKLKEQLSDAEKEIRRLSERSDGGSSNSPTSSFSNVVDVDPPFFGEFGVVDDGLDNVFYVPDTNYVSGGMGMGMGMDWGYPYDHLL